MDEFWILPADVALGCQSSADKFTCPSLIIYSDNNITSLSSKDLGDAIIKIDFLKMYECFISFRFTKT